MNRYQERLFVEQAAPGLGWEILEQRESPDFIVREGLRSFGLELTEVFNGAKGKRGQSTRNGSLCANRLLTFIVDTMKSRLA